MGRQVGGQVGRQVGRQVGTYRLSYPPIYPPYLPTYPLLPLIFLLIFPLSSHLFFYLSNYTATTTIPSLLSSHLSFNHFSDLPSHLSSCLLSHLSLSLQTLSRILPLVSPPIVLSSYLLSYFPPHLLSPFPNLKVNSPHVFPFLQLQCKYLSSINLSLVLSPTSLILSLHCLLLLCRFLQLRHTYYLTFFYHLSSSSL